MWPPRRCLSGQIKLNQKNIALITLPDSFGSPGREQLKKMAAKRGFKIVADELHSNQGYGHEPATLKDQSGQTGCHHLLGHRSGSRRHHQQHVVSKRSSMAGADAAQGIMLPAGKLAVYGK